VFYLTINLFLQKKRQ